MFLELRLKSWDLFQTLPSSKNWYNFFWVARLLCGARQNMSKQWSSFQKAEWGICRVLDTNSRNSVLIYEEILVKHPTDILSLKFAHDCYFYLGDSNNIRDSIARVLKHWSQKFSSTSIFGNVLGMYSFGLEEMNFYNEAEKIGRLALEKNSNDAWAHHAIAHCMEMVDQHFYWKHRKEDKKKE